MIRSDALQMRIHERRERGRVDGGEVVPAARHDVQPRVGQPSDQALPGRDGADQHRPLRSATDHSSRPIAAAVAAAVCQSYSTAWNSTAQPDAVRDAIA